MCCIRACNDFSHCQLIWCQVNHKLFIFTGDSLLTITADNAYTVFADGILLGNGNAWSRDQTYRVPGNTNIVSVYAMNWVSNSKNISVYHQYFASIKTEKKSVWHTILVLQT